MKRFFLTLVVLVWVLSLPTAGKTEGVQVPILLYHRFGPRVADSMTVTTPVFESHLQYLQDHGYRVIRLRDVVDYRLGKLASRDRERDTPMRCGFCLSPVPFS